MLSAVSLCPHCSLKHTCEVRQDASQAFAEVEVSAWLIGFRECVADH